MPAMSASATDTRAQQASTWARDVLNDKTLKIEPLTGDASFRRYFRIEPGVGRDSLLLMDTPPDRENPGPFLNVDRRLRDAGIHAPEIFRFDSKKGFGIIEDLGDLLYREVIDENSAQALFPGLFDLLELMNKEVSPNGLPPYDRSLLQAELDLFPEWYLARHRNRPFGGKESECWRIVCEALIENAERQPQVFVHRDFHSCNLIFRDGGSPGVIDFQDAVRGPVTYDFISLIWDRYIHWPRPKLETWMSDVHSRLAPDIDLDTWVRCCDLMGLQRNLKVVGIFARLRYRDDKRGYLEMIPMFYRYLLDVLPRYPEFDGFLDILGDDSCAP